MKAPPHRLVPRTAWQNLRIASRLLAKKLGQRTLIDVIPLSGDAVRGSHGRLPENDADGPLFLSTSSIDRTEHVDALEVKERILRTVFA